MIFDLTKHSIYSFPVKSEYDYNGDPMICVQKPTMKYLPHEMFSYLVNNRIFYVLMGKEKKSGYRKYKCEVESFDLDKRSITFNFYLKDFSKNEMRKLKIKNLIGSI